MASNNVTVPILTGSNFNNWKFRIQAILEKEQLITVIKEDPPTDDTKKKEYLINDSKAKSVIIQGVSDKHLDLIKDATSAKGMLNALQNVFVRSSSFSKLTLWRKLVTLKCTKRDSLEDHFLKFDTITRELEDFGSKINESDKVCHLLLSLPKEYETVVTALETQIELKMDFVKSRLLDEETKIKGDRNLLRPSLDSNNELSFNASEVQGCFNCGDKRHYAAYCPKRRSSNSSRGRFYSNRRVFRSNRGGNGRFNTRPNERANNVTTGELSFIALEGSITKPNTKVGYSEENSFILDSGASNHLVKEDLEPYMTDIKSLDQQVNIFTANGQAMSTNKIGKLYIACQNKKISVEALIVPDLKHNLLALSKLTEKGFQVVIDKNNMSINSTKGCKVIADCQNGLYSIKFKPIGLNVNSEECYATQADGKLWHRRLGHLNRNGLIKLGLPYSNEKCVSCVEGKATRLPFKKNYQKSTHIGQLVHTDICGPVNPLTHDGYKYFQVIIDDFSHFTIVNLLKSKNEAEDYLMNYVSEVETQHGAKVQRIRLDNGGEVTSKNFKAYARSRGIKLQYTLPYSPQSNGKSERMNRTLLNMTRTKLAESAVPKELWGEAIRCSAYELNRSPSTVLEYGQTPSMLWYGKQDISKLKVFGCQVWYTCTPKGNKLDLRAKCGIMIGYCGGGYRIWCPESRRVVSSRDVVFNEIVMHFKQNKIVLQQPENNSETEDQIEIDEEEEVDRTEDEPEKLSTEQLIVNPTRPTRNKQAPPYLQDYDVYTAYCLLTSCFQPTTFKEAINEPEWKSAIESELKSHENLGTWESVSVLPPDQKAIDTKWVFTTKNDGTKKARLVAKGFQLPFKYEELTYAPVCRMSTVRILLSQAVNKEWPIKQIDIPTAFLNGNLKDEIFINKPEGVKSLSNVLKLKRALYGLRISPKCWNDTFNETVEKFGLTRSKYDFCLYSSDDIYLLLFVDDALITGLNEKVQELITFLSFEFKTKKLGESKNFLGMEFKRNENGLMVQQTKIVERLLEDFQMENCHGISTPMEVGFRVEESDPIIEVPYRSLICSLMYLAVTSRPDLSFAVSVLSRVLDKPTDQTWKAAKRVLRYLSETKELGIFFSKQTKSEMTAFSDADWGGDHISRKSTSGYISFHGVNPISWSSKKQTCVALSTMEAEYYSAATAAQDLMNLKGVMCVFDKCNQRPVLKVDSASAISMVKTYQNSKRGKHIDIKAHFIKDLYFKNEIDVQYVSTQFNVADLFTKALCKEKFVKFRNAVMNVQ